MNKEQSFFLNVLRNYIHGDITEIPNLLNWGEIYNLGEAHQLNAIIYNQCKEGIPDKYIASFKSSYLNTIYMNIRRKRITDVLLLRLKDSRTEPCLIKGSIIAGYYPNWQDRSMSDTDIVVNDIEKAHSVLMNNGFSCLSKANTNNGEYKYSIHGMSFELHNRLVYNETINVDSVTAFLNNYKMYLSNGKLDDSFHFIFVVNHLRKHFMNHGVGFRQFLDVALLIKNNTNINWKWTEERLSEIGLLPFAKKVLYYVGRWFDLSSLPFISESVSESIFEESTKYVFSNGVFGFSNSENEKAHVINNMRASDFPRFVMIKSMLQSFFPSYKLLIISENYSFLRDKPVLLPVAWGYRFVRAIKNNRIIEGKKQISNTIVSKEYIDKRMKMLRNWEV